MIKIFKLFILCLLCLVSTNSFAERLYVRGSLLHFLADPGQSTASNTYQYFPDGLLVVDNGKIVKAGAWQQLKPLVSKSARLVHYKKGLIVPGFIDTHIHFPQLDMIAADSGGDLLQWLKKYTFPFEEKFKDPAYARDVAQFFLQQLLVNGTTTANIFTTGYAQAVDVLFNQAEKRHMRILTGQVLADVNLSPELQQEPQIGIAQTEKLITKWHNKAGTRLIYSVQLRFPPTTSKTLFRAVASLMKRHPDVHFHSHVSENRQEIAWVKQLFNSDYLAVFDKYHLLGPNTLLAHGVWLTDEEWQRVHDSHSHIAFCPTSNLYLGSGLFKLQQADAHQAQIGMGTDVGAGTSFSMLQTLNEAYKVAQMQQQNLTALRGFYLITLGGAKALNLQDKLGNFLPGKEADFVVLNAAGATPLLKRRLQVTKNLEEKLFVLMMLGDDRSIQATYVNGHKVAKT